MILCLTTMKNNAMSFPALLRCFYALLHKTLIETWESHCILFRGCQARLKLWRELNKWPGDRIKRGNCHLWAPLADQTLTGGLLIRHFTSTSDSLHTLLWQTQPTTEVSVRLVRHILLMCTVLYTMLCSTLST